jgi:hypothetical protein
VLSTRAGICCHSLPRKALLLAPSRMVEVGIHANAGKRFREVTGNSGLAEQMGRSEGFREPSKSLGLLLSWVRMNGYLI